MALVIELIKGILMGIGVIIGILLTIAYLMKRVDKEDSVYVAEDLIEPFENYLLYVTQNENYEEITEVKKMLESLETGNVPDEIHNYIIKTEKSFKISDVNDGSLLKMVRVHTIINRVQWER